MTQAPAGLRSSGEGSAISSPYYCTAGRPDVQYEHDVVDKHAAPGGSLTLRRAASCLFSWAVALGPQGLFVSAPTGLDESLQFTDTRLVAAPPYVHSSTLGRPRRVSSLDSERFYKRYDTKWLLKLKSHFTDSDIVEDSRDQYYTLKISSKIVLFDCDCLYTLLNT